MIDDGRSSHPHRQIVGRWRIFFLGWILLSALMIVWSLATPIAAAPDEPAHIVKAASVVRGQFIGEPSKYGHVVRVPRYVAATQAQTCFAFHPEVPASCARPLPGRQSELIDSTTTAGRYNPVYYLLVGWPSLLFGDVAGIYAMRMVSAALSALFLALSVMTIWTFRLRTIPLLAIGIAATPTLLFLGGVVNPNALEATGLIAVFVATMGIIAQPDPRLLTERCAILTVSAVLAVNTRALSPLWLAVAVLVPLITASRPHLVSLLRQRAVRWTVSAVAVASTFAVAWILWAGSLSSGLTDKESFQQYPGVGTSHLVGFILTLRDTLEYGASMVGMFGWLDTPAPEITTFVWAALCGAILLASFVVLRGSKLVMAVVLVACFVLLPATVQGIYITGGGMIWQGRYALPIFGMLVIGLAFLISERYSELTRWMLMRTAIIVGAALLIAQTFAFATVLRRYAAGTNGTVGNAFIHPLWSAPGGNIALLGLYGLIALVTAIVGVRVSLPQRVEQLASAP